MSASFDYAVAMNFSWLEQGRIAGCRGPRSDSDLAFLHLESNVGTLSS